MTFEPPDSSSTKQFRAVQLTNYPPPYVLKGVDEPDSEWNLVERQPIATLVPSPGGSGFLPQTVTVTYADTSVRVFESDHDQVLVAPVTRRRGGTRQHVREVADARGFQVLPDGAKDLYHLGWYDVVVHYDGDEATMATRSQVGQQLGMTIPGAAAKSAALSWLTTPPPPRVV